MCYNYVGDNMKQVTRAKEVVEMEKKSYTKELERRLVTTTMENLPMEVEQRKNELCDKIEQFKLNTDEENYIKGSKSIIVSDYFFKSLNPYTFNQPKYSTERLSIAFDLYKKTINEINLKICRFYPTVSHFCGFLGITTATYEGYKTSSDIDMQHLVEMIDDWIFDTNMRLSEGREIDNVTAMFRAKVEQRKTEQAVPTTVVFAENLNMSEIKERVHNLTQIKKGNTYEVGNKTND